ncbi:MAG TPA: hypothetical protein VIT91_03025 [Chthoniobacterales bacterium]
MNYRHRFKKSYRSIIRLQAMAGTLVGLASVPLVSFAEPIEPETKLTSKGNIRTPGSFQYPNGIARSTDGKLYVGSVVSGKILEVSPDGKIIDYFSGSEDILAAVTLRLDEPRGLLWGSAPDFLGTKQADGTVTRRPANIFVMDVATKQVRQLFQLPDKGFPNDLVLDEKGGAFVTDSTQPRIHYIAPGATKSEIWVEDPKFSGGKVLLSGIVRTTDGVIYVAQFSTGKIFKVTKAADGKATVTELPLARPLETPDGMALDEKGRLIVLEGAIKSGDGKISLIDPSEPSAAIAVQTLAQSLTSPANLTIQGSAVYVTEARLRHRLVPGLENQVPSEFFIRQYELE